ncbi:MAG TPA: nucleoside deaminase [Ktedonobacteraceae bacterium]|nr:nucleoside deaminase [Ktedonobacteraceae bacterium]
MDSDPELSYFLEKAMQEAEEASKATTYPVGAIIVNPEGEIIGRGHNHVYHHGDYTSHAEMEAIRNAGCRLMKKPNYNACTLYTTLEPCLMCCGAILLARIKCVVWVKNDDLYGALRCLCKQNPCQESLPSPSLLPDGYIEKITSLSIISEPEHDLASKMDSWMDQWNAMKQARLHYWEDSRVEK